MGSLERRRREKSEMQQFILDAAAKLFIEEGFERTTIRRIADEIEYTPGAIYSYFKDKDEILYALHFLAFDKFYIELKASLVASQNPMEQLHSLGRAYINFALKNPQYYDLMFIMTKVGRKIAESDGWKVGENAFGLLQSTLQKCMDTGHLPQGNAQAAAMMIWSMVHGIVALTIRERFICQPDQLNGLIDTGLDYMMETLSQKAVSG